MALKDILSMARLPVATKEKLPQLLATVDTNTLRAEQMAEYRAACKAVGVDEADLAVEEFRAFLGQHDIPTFNLHDVVAYMDKLAARDNPTGLGWHWCPVRLKDADIPMRFGTMPIDGRFGGKTSAGSDFYSSHDMDGLRRSARGITPVNSEYEIFWHPMDMRTHRSPAYTHTIPVHALRKIALIEREWKGPQVVFLVSDYATKGAFALPDPFLMAVIPNGAVAFGKGRFVIDVWDEPGFGLEQRLLG